MSRSKELVNIEGRELQHEQHYLIIDEYFNNGFNGSKAILKHRPGITEATSRSLFNTISKLTHVKAYIGEKRQQLRAQTNIEPEQVINELITWIYSDATDYISLTPEEIKSLPREAKQCIQSIKHRKKEYYDRQGNAVVEEVLEVRIIDKTKAVEILNKMLGNYALDNNQKKSTVNIGNLNVQELKVLANILRK
jgi:hypothetical protein